jgi:hypothetical protein
MPKTRVELGNGALKRLGKLVAGESPDAVSAQAIDDFIDPLLANLNARSVIYLPDANEIPDEAYEPLRLRLAWASAGEFGVPLDSLPDCAPSNSEADLRALGGIQANKGDVVDFEDF